MRVCAVVGDLRDDNKYVLHNCITAGCPRPGCSATSAILVVCDDLARDFRDRRPDPSLRDRRAPKHRADVPLPRPAARPRMDLRGAGALMLIVPILLRSTPLAAYLAAPVWLGFILLFDPLNARAGASLSWETGAKDAARVGHLSEPDSSVDSCGNSGTAVGRQ